MATGTSSGPAIGVQVVRERRAGSWGSWAPARIASRLLQTAIDPCQACRLPSSVRISHSPSVYPLLSDTLHSNGGPRVIHPPVRSPRSRAEE